MKEFCVGTRRVLQITEKMFWNILEFAGIQASLHPKKIEEKAYEHTF
ncbi:MAG: hypothetical protein ACFE7I_06615 [Candidatus Hodarchaeota archaeon]